ncbi:MAG: phospholipase D-like domain-containing protein [Chloroflexota bacterium]|nr:phospholipase D-like domain-containing protein [Chloroflexota bacterium]
MTILHAHSEPQFTDYLRSVIGEGDGRPHSVDIAVGYFYLSGYTQVADLLANRPGRVRILIGRTDTPTRQEIVAGYNPREAASDYLHRQNRREEAVARDETLDNVGRNAAAQPQDERSEAGIKSLARLIANGRVDVRAYLKGRMHAKAYIGYTGLTANPGTAIIGSTNFSSAGFMGNTELNYPVSHSGDIQEIKQWFERLWNESEPVADRVVEQLNSSWPLAQPDPYLIYLKVLYELYGATLGDQTVAMTVPPVELTDYQQDAVAAGMAMLELHGGCYIADVVGMGKTYVGAEILRRLALKERDAGDPLIICPASLRDMWDRTCDLFGLNDADVLSRGRLTEAAVASDRSLQKMLRNAGPVLIDEAHGFRNNSQRRRVLLNLLKGSKRHRVILLSATPQNLAPRDILRQLELFLDVNHHELPGVGGNLSQYFPGDPSTAEPQQIAKILRNVLIRRRRQDIQEHYQNSTLNGRPVQFPQPRLSNREYSLDHAYRKAGGIEKITSLLKQYQASRYKPGEYLHEDKKSLSRYANIVQSQRGNLAGIMTTNLWKRLESSIPAFQSTLQTLLRSNREFRNQILSGGVSQDDGSLDSEEALTIDLPNDEELDTDQLDQEEEYLTIRDRSYPAEDFDCPRWLDDLEQDRRILAALLDALEDIQPSDDAKLYEIKSFLKSPGVAGEKVLIFTESKVTARYLLSELQSDNPGVKIDLLVGGDGRTGQKVARFSPKSNDRPDMPESEQTRILIATDVIAEGQNLQDCNRVFSYDIHWNPVTLIQRYGRVDRITTEHTEVYLHNMMPDPTVENTIGVRERVRDRVQAFHDLIGLDNAILENGEQVNPDSIYGIYEGEMPLERDDISDNLAVAQQANALLNRIRREQPDLWTRLWLMPDGLRAAMTGIEQPNPGSTIVLTAWEEVKQGYAVNSAGQVKRLTEAELVRQVECAPGTLAVPLPDNTNERVGAAAAALAASMAPQPVTLEPRQWDGRVSRYINEQLALLRLDDQADATRLRHLESLRVAFNSELPIGVNEKIETLMRKGIEGDPLVSSLTAMLAELRPSTATVETHHGVNTDIRIVCSLGIVSG